MVFHKALPFTRITFGKSLTHGPQSVVAASQSWNASHPLNNRFQKHHAHSHTHFATLQTKSKDTNDAGSFTDHLKKWQRDQKLDANHWRQYQIHKPLEWKAKENDASQEEQKSVQETEKSLEEESYVASESIESVAPEIDRTKTPSSSSVRELVLENASSEQQQTVVSPYSEQISLLLVNKHYAEIPAIFEGLLSSEFKPVASDYNALLSAAFNIPTGSTSPISKALDIYADMLQRNVLPDVQTYTIIIERLAFNALHTDAMKSDLVARSSRYHGHVVIQNNAEVSRLSQDESLTVAMRLFDAALSLYPAGPFTERTYRLLISACATHSNLPEMVTVYSHMDHQNIVPTADIFVSMIPTFGSTGDMDNAIEMYKEYKKLAIKDSIVRKDNDIYAALVKAYTLAGDSHLATEFMDRLRETAASEADFKNIQDTVALKALVPVWLEKGDFQDAISFVKHKLGPEAREIGLSAICIRAADRDNHEFATEAFNSLSENADVVKPAFAMSAMHIRNGDLDSAHRFMNMVATSPANLESLELATMHSIAMIKSGHSLPAIQNIRSALSELRQSYQRSDIQDSIAESVEVIANSIQSQPVQLSVEASVEFLSLIADNGLTFSPFSAHLIATIGPEDITQLTPSSLELLAQVQASMVLQNQHFDVGNAARISYIVDLILLARIETTASTQGLVRDALVKLDQGGLLARWDNAQFITSDVMYSPAPFSPAQFSLFPGSPNQPNLPTFEDSHDPYSASTDNKGSVMITDLLEKNHGKFSSHLNEALVKFRNMRRLGRHPRFFTYAKLISAAAKDNRIELAHEILAMARQDVPYQAQYRIVRFGWISILDAMVAACLQTSQRHLAEQFHQELRSIGASPSANTFGLYITTLKESTKTFDEASEALKIFLQAKNEGVEPTSFLYNALIGKLGKARRIDDCLFYFQEMRGLGIRPTSVTYGTIVNALCRVSDEKFAEELFEEMENMPNYKARPAPYHSMMQFFLTTKRDRSKVLLYYERMRNRNITPTAHTFKLLIDTYATLDPVDMKAAENVLDEMHRFGMQPDAVHYSSLIHAKGCVEHDMAGARALFNKVMSQSKIRPQPCLYQALFESMVANSAIADSDALLLDMRKRHVELTPYVANALIQGWAMSENMNKAEAIFRQVPQDKREPSTYEAMTRAYMMADQREKALSVVNEALARGYPTAVASKILDLVGTKTAWWTPPSSSIESPASATL
jgi:pentatricopeptide repeat protein